MKQFNSAKEYKDYIDKKHRAPWKNTLSRIDAVQAELAKVRGKFPAATPPGLSAEQAKAFADAQAASVKVFQYCDRYLASLRVSANEYSAALKKACE